jgi:PAS domain S-box-containing protein
MNDLSKKINNSMNLAHHSFKQLMRLNANSIPVLRQYSGFLLDLANEPEQARVMLARADELEDEQSKVHADGALDANSFNDRQAVVSVSAEPKTLGQVMQVNPVALRLLGYSKAEILGRNIAVIVPAPFAAHHQGYLKHYTDLGNSSILNMSRPAWALHKSGFLVPLNLFVREVSSETSHVFLGALKEIVSPFQMGFVDLDFHLFGCTVALGHALSVEIVEMHAGKLHLSRWIHNLESVKGQLFTPDGFEFSAVQDGSGALFTIRMWLTTLHVTGESRDWYMMRAQVTAAPSLSSTASFSRGKSFAAAPARFVSDGDRKELDKGQVNVDDEGDDENDGDSSPSIDISDLGVEFLTSPAAIEAHRPAQSTEATLKSPALRSSSDKPKARIMHSGSAVEAGPAASTSPMHSALEMTSPRAPPSNSLGQVARVGVSRDALLPLNAAALHQQDDAKRVVTRVATFGDGGSIDGSATSKSALSVHSKFRSFSKSRDSHKLSSALRSLQVALALALGFIVFASILRFFIVKSSIDDYVSALNSISKSGLIRVLPTTFSVLVQRMILTRLGFYQNYSTDAIRAQMKPLVEQFAAYDEDLYLGSSRAQVAANAELRGLWENSQLAFNSLQAGVWTQPRRSLWDATQSLQTAVTAIITGGDSKLDLTDQHVFWVLLNADGAIRVCMYLRCFLGCEILIGRPLHVIVSSS